jgi:hypothetical protein
VPLPPTSSLHCQQQPLVSLKSSSLSSSSCLDACFDQTILQTLYARDAKDQGLDMSAFAAALPLLHSFHSASAIARTREQQALQQLHTGSIPVAAFLKLPRDQDLVDQLRLNGGLRSKAAMVVKAPSPTPASPAAAVTYH